MKYTVPAPGSDWDEELINCALTFGGYDFAGVHDGPDPFQIEAEYRRAFDEHGELPEDLDLLRFILFIICRNDYGGGGYGFSHGELQEGGYIYAVLEGINRLSGGSVEDGPGERRLNRAETL